MTALHHRAYQVVIGLIGVHLLAQLIYGLRRDPTPLAMFTGRKPAAVASTRHYPVRALLTAAGAGFLVWWGLGL